MTCHFMWAKMSFFAAAYNSGDLTILRTNKETAVSEVIFQNFSLRIAVGPLTVISVRSHKGAGFFIYGQNLGKVTVQCRSEFHGNTFFYFL